jgi:hypothetical protein
LYALNLEFEVHSPLSLSQMATAREENGYEDGGGFGKFRKRPFRRTQTTPYDRPPTALRNPNHNNGWLSKLIDPAQRLITYSAHRLFSSVFRKRLPAPPSGFSLIHQLLNLIELRFLHFQFFFCISSRELIVFGVIVN